MATKKQLAEQAMRIILGGTPTVDREIDIREVMLFLDQARDLTIKLTALQSRKAGIHEVSTDYLSQYEDVSIQTDAAKQLRYITLPASPIDLPDEMGIYMISAMQNPEIGFFRIAGVGLPLYRDMLSVNVEAFTYYWVVGSKVYFKNVDPTLGEVLVTMVASSKDIAEDANYPVPPDVEATLLEQIIKVFAVMQEAPHDEITDGVK